MKNAIKLLVLAVIGYAAYEMIEGYLRHRKNVGGPAGRGVAPIRTSRAMPEPMGRVAGAAMTGTGEGVTERTLDQDGESTSTRVGRGVVSRQASKKKKA